MATDYKNSAGERKSKYFKVAAWGEKAEVCKKYLKSGNVVRIVCKIKVDPDTGSPRVYQKNDKTWSASNEVTLTVLTLMPNGKSGNNEKIPLVTEEDDIPF